MTLAARAFLLIAAFAAPLMATEPNPSQRQRALIDELLKVMHADDLA